MTNVVRFMCVNLDFRLVRWFSTPNLFSFNCSLLPGLPSFSRPQSWFFTGALLIGLQFHLFFFPKWGKSVRVIHLYLLTVHRYLRPMKWIKIAALLLMAGVFIGAFGAHGLREKLDPQKLNSYLTGVQYLYYHSFALLFTGLLILSGKLSEKALNRTGYLFLSGIVVFSGSIFLLSTHELTGLELSFLGPITPLGGLLFAAGWLSLALSVSKRNKP